MLTPALCSPFWPVTEFLDGTRRKMAAATKAMDSFAYGVIEEREREGRGSFTGAQKEEAAEKDVSRDRFSSFDRG
jgi:hypothetical protein